MYPHRLWFTFLLGIYFSTFSLSLSLAEGPAAPQLDAASQEALTKTRQLLENRSERDAAISKDSKAVEVNQRVHALAGSQAGADALYSLSGAVFQELVTKTGGDSKKMMEILDRAKSDPAAFANSLSPEVQKQITDYSKTVPAAGGAANSGSTATPNRSK